MNLRLLCLLLAVRLVGMPGVVAAFELEDRWMVTATDGTVAGSGLPVTVTWSIVPDGTPIREEDNTPSDLIARFDDIYDETSDSEDVTTRTWFSLFAQAFDRWSELGGAEFVYEEADTGSPHGEVMVGDGKHFAGKLGIRGDVRIGGAPVDGNAGTLAYNYYPDVGDMMLDTSDDYFVVLSNDSRRLVNTVIHEAGHALGLGHVKTTDQASIMTETVPTSFDGPQFDDVLGLHQLYGDRLERSHDGAGNNSPDQATHLGPLDLWQTIALGTSATDDVRIAPDEDDFVSLTNHNDTDFFRFTLSNPATVAIELLPVGPTYSIGPAEGTAAEFNASSISDLALELWDADETPLATADEFALGEAENIGLELSTAGDYVVQVTGTGNDAQLYQLNISATPLLPGDYNGDGLLDMADYTVWRDSLGAEGPLLPADGNGDQLVDRQDYQVWKGSLGAAQAATVTLTTAPVPEPGSVALASLAAWLVGCTRRRHDAGCGSTARRVGSVH